MLKKINYVVIEYVYATCNNMTTNILKQKRTGSIIHHNDVIPVLFYYLKKHKNRQRMRLIITFS